MEQLSGIISTPRDFLDQLDNAVPDHETFEQWVEENLPVESYDAFEDRLASNLDDGKLSFVIVMDQLNDRLRSLIRYLTANANYDLYGVELDYHKTDDKTIVVPRLYGTEVKKSSSTSSRASQQPITADEFIDTMAEKFDMRDEAEAWVEAVRNKETPSVHRTAKNYGVKVTSWGVKRPGPDFWVDDPQYAEEARAYIHEQSPSFLTESRLTIREDTARKIAEIDANDLTTKQCIELINFLDDCPGAK